MTCASCARPTPNRYCSWCKMFRLENRYPLDEGADDDTYGADGELEYRCTDCGHEWETTEPGACPECGACRRRYIGELSARP